MRTLQVLACVLTSLGLVACGGAAASPSAPTAPASSAVAPSVAKPAASTSAAAGASAAPASATGTAPLSPPVKVIWAVSGLAPEAGIYIAKEKGYFQQEGLDVDLQIFRAFTDELPLLATGQLAYGTGGLNPDLFNAVNRDIPVRIATANAIGTAGDASAALLVRQDLVDNGRYKELKDLKGMTLGHNSLGTSSQLITDRILAKVGLGPADVTYTNVPFANMSTALANKAVDSVFDVEPFVNGIVTRNLAKKVITGAEGFPGAINQVIVISPIFARQQPEAARRAIYAFLRGQREYLAAFISGTNPAGKDEIIQILTKYTALKDPKAYVGMGMSGGDPNGAVDVNVLKEFQDYFLKMGSQKQPADVTKMFDPTYVNYAVQRLGRV